MKKTLITLICATVAVAATVPTASAKVKKNDLSKKEVKVELEKIAVDHPDHFIERMKIYEWCTLKYEDENGEDLYYHFYSATLKKAGYRIIVYDNTPTYLGYYAVDLEPADYEEGILKLQLEETSDDGDDLYAEIEFPKKGPPKKIRISHASATTFIPNPLLEKKEETAMETGGIPAVPKETAPSGEEIDYRDWTITKGGKTATVNAIFIKFEKGKVTIKSSKSGREVEIPGSALSEADKEYVKRITAE